MFAQSPFFMLKSAATQLRWVFFTLFTLHVFGDIFLGRSARKIKGFDFLAVIFIIYAFLSVVYSPFPSLTLERSTTVLVLYISVFWIIWKYAYEQSPEKVVYLMLNVIKLILIFSFLMIFIFPHRVFLSGRFEGVLQNPNSLGITCAIFLPLMLWQFLETKKRGSLFFFFLMLIGLLLSASRNSINASVIALGYFIYMRSMKNKPLILFSSLSFILMLVWFMQTLAKEFFHVYYRVESISSIGGRIDLWPAALNLITLKPIFGYGFGVEERILYLKNAMLNNQPGSFVHNSYLGMLLQLGIIGLAIFFIPLFVLLLKELFARRDAPVPFLRHALRASFMAGLLCSIFESWVYSVGNAQAFPFWIMVMLLVFYRYQDREKLLPEDT
jgi:O-antigen ligase